MFNIDPLCVYAYILYEITCMCFYDDKRKCRTSYFYLDVMFIKSVFLIQLILSCLWFAVGCNFNAILMVIIIDSDVSTALCVKHVCTGNSCEFYRLFLLMLKCMLFRTECPKRSVTLSQNAKISKTLPHNLLRLVTETIQPTMYYSASIYIDFTIPQCTLTIFWDL